MCGKCQVYTGRVLGLVSGLRVWGSGCICIDVWGTVTHCWQWPGQTRRPIIQLRDGGLVLRRGSRDGGRLSENSRCFFEGWLPNIDLKRFVDPLFSKMVSSVIVHETT
jgi:hypothetical protein